MADQQQEEIVMTPSKTGQTTIIQIAKVRKTAIDSSQVAHKAGGQHSGLVINKQSADVKDDKSPDLQLEFKCFLVDQKTGKHVPESRVLKFWFSPETDYLDKVTGAYEFFKELVKPHDFPRDYVGFIKKIMKQLQRPEYQQMKKCDVHLTPIEEMEGPPPSPGSDFRTATGMVKEDNRPKNVIVQEQLLVTLESAYPNILPMEDLAKLSGADDTGMVVDQLKVLEGRNLIKQMEPGKWVRKVLDEKSEVKIVKTMPVATAGSKPTVAIITSKYSEKLAVDSMMTERTTFVKYKTEGESNVYTIGYIGSHKVVSTKLPMIGRQMAAQISSGNTTTRLLGTFGDIEHVFLVGVAGGVPHYTDFYKHPRLGDVVIGTPNQKGTTFIYCDKITHDSVKGAMQYTLKSWSPIDSIILETANRLEEEHRADPLNSPWMQHLKEGQEHLQTQEASFLRPAPETDRLYMNIGGQDVIEVGHPPMPEDADASYRPGISVIRHGAIGSGKPIIKDDNLRFDFAARHDCVAFDTEFDQVLESVVGNRKDSFAFIRGVADYLDGTKNVAWQSYAALSAAAYMRAIIENLPSASQD